MMIESTLLAAGVPTGAYIGVAKLIAALILTAAWAGGAAWVDRDVEKLKGNRLLWSGIMVGSGIVALFLWFILPYFLLAMVLWLLIVGGAFGAYIWIRNQLVPDRDKVMTTDGVGRFFGKQAALTQAEQVELNMAFIGGNGLPVRPDVEPALSGWQLACHVLFDAVNCRSDLAELIPSGQVVNVRYHIDGVMTQRDRIEPADAALLTAFVKSQAGMNPEDLRRPQQGRCTIRVFKRDILLRVRTAGTLAGEQVHMRIQDEARQIKAENLGLNNEQVQQLEQIKDTGGLVAVTGPLQSGVTSTLYALLRMHDLFMRNVCTLEIEPLEEILNVTQRIFDPGANKPFHRELASVLHTDPDVVMVEPVRDKDTAMAALGAADEKRRVYVGFQAPDTLTALGTLLKWSGQRKVVAKALRAVLNQTLLRKLCPKCRQAYKPDPNLLRRANLPVGKIDVFYRPPRGQMVDNKGNPIVCDACGGTGYRERIAVVEMMVIDDPLREMISGGSGAQAIRAYCRKQKMLYLQEQGLQKVVSGVTGINEVIRVTGKQKKEK